MTTALDIDLQQILTDRLTGVSPDLLRVMTLGESGSGVSFVKVSARRHGALTCGGRGSWACDFESVRALLPIWLVSLSRGFVGSVLRSVSPQNRRATGDGVRAAMVSPLACFPGTAESWPTPRSVGIRS